MSHPAANRIYPLPKRTYPLLRGVDAFPWVPGSRKRILLNERGYPFSDLQISRDFTVTLAEHQSPTAGGFTTVTAGSFPDILSATRFVSWTPVLFASAGIWTLRLTESGGLVRTRTVTVDTDVRIATRFSRHMLRSPANQALRPFATASFASTATGITSVKYAVTGPYTVAKTDIPRVSFLAGSTHSGASGAAILTDSTASFLEHGVRIGDVVSNDTDGSEATVTAVDATTVTGTLSGGTDDDWDTGDAYTVYAGGDFIQRVRRWEFKPQATGSFELTLYVHDGTSEFSESTFVEVA